jgi:hypothetical protein
VRWSARITATAREGRNIATRKRNNDEAPLTEHDPAAPDVPLHTVHDVGPEQVSPEDNPVTIRALARTHTRDAFEVLREVMMDSEVTGSTRVIAAMAVLDRAWGKVTTPTPADDARDAPQLETIRRIIVDPGHSDEPGLHPAASAGPL